MRHFLLGVPWAVLVCTGPVSFAGPVQWPVQDGGNGHYYEPVLVPAGISWTDANAAATAAGGYLATLTSEAENNFAFSLVKDVPEFWDHHPSSTNLHGTWLGGYQPAGAPEPAGGWRWVTDEPWDYTCWGSGQGIVEPDNYLGNQQYLEYFRFGGAMVPTWNDEHNVNSDPPIHGYIIEYIPEPGVLSLLALGGMAILRRGRRGIRGR